jgi:diguanylate cyclase (GGDEF)-like protein
MMGHQRPWLLLALSVAMVGIVASVMASMMVVRNAAQKSHQSFITSSIEIASTLKLALDREQDLGVNAAGFILGNHTASETQFQQWTTSVRLFQRYPELQGIGEVVLVSASQLGAFASAHGGASFQVSPSGPRPYYCFTTLTQGRTASSVLPPGVDVCASDLGPALIAGLASGRPAYLPYGTGKTSALAIGSAVYKGGTVPSTIQARKALFVGWVGIQILPHVLLATALEGHPNTAVSFHFNNGSSMATFQSGPKAVGASATSVDLHNGWHVEVFASTDGGGVIDNPAALALLLAGVLVSLLLGLLVYVLGTGRSRAMRLVEERTEQLHHQALHDPLTGLPNRALILDRIGQMLVRGRRHPAAPGVLFLDLDDFKDINDTLGHRAGDELLVAVGARLQGELREGDTVGRLGGDEFVIVTEGSPETGGPQAVADRILEVLRTPFQIPSSDVPLAVTASIGFAEGDRATSEELLQDADIALYEAKAAGKQRAAEFSLPMREAVDDHRQIELDLRGALEGDQFHLVYQPTIDLRSGEFTGVEALLRWLHPVRGVVMPDQFIPALESSGLIVPVGGWVLEEACRQGATWNRRGHALNISVNVSAKQLERDRIADDVHGALSKSQLDPNLLILELTESTLMIDADSTIERLNLLKAIGVRIAIDDFGTGFSSLAYLQRFPIDVLKIDRSFVSSMVDTKEAAAIVHTLVELGKALGLETIAEGIETDDQRARLSEEHVDHGQGFLFARPMEVEALTRLFEESSKSDVVVAPR